jgi:hypothetical protein
MKNLVRVLVGLSIIPAIFMCLMSFMMFDAPGSEKNPLTIFLVLAVWSYPVMAAGGIAMSFKNFKWMLLPLVSVVLFVAGNILLGIFCGGKFTCR